MASGRARLHTYVIHHRDAPGYTAPYSIAVVELQEGPRMMTNIVDCAQNPDALEIDMELDATYLAVNDEVTLVQFHPIATAR